MDPEEMAALLQDVCNTLNRIDSRLISIGAFYRTAEATETAQKVHAEWKEVMALKERVREMRQKLI